ncbi:hypothetical protein, partial [Allosphingosinicella sp.]|uniref:phosphoribosylanthranilate isomerase n=1 Tax=Allosphingosinicella sp. TaxID=2823234 RepID=UPI002EDE6900
DVERLAPFADAFLVGTSLMRAEDPAMAARGLAFGRVKVCGLTNPEDLGAAAEAGASFAGLVMVPNTPRALTRSRAERLAEVARGRGLRSVGVFRNEKLMQVASTALGLGLDAVQLHGEEDSAYVRALRNLLGGSTEIWTVSGVGREVPKERAGTDRTLFDTCVNGRSGGTGVPFDWSRVRRRAELDRSILAGGLSPCNARGASQVGAFALDVGSGVEAEPGRKDPVKLRAFFEALRPAVRGEAIQ